MASLGFPSVAKKPKTTSSSSTSPILIVEDEQTLPTFSLPTVPASPFSALLLATTTTVSHQSKLPLVTPKLPSPDVAVDTTALPVPSDTTTTCHITTFATRCKNCSIPVVATSQRTSRSERNPGKKYWTCPTCNGWVGWVGQKQSVVTAPTPLLAETATLPSIQGVGTPLVAVPAEKTPPEARVVSSFQQAETHPSLNIDQPALIPLPIVPDAKSFASAKMSSLTRFIQSHLNPFLQKVSSHNGTYPFTASTVTASSTDSSNSAVESEPWIARIPPFAEHVFRFIDVEMIRGKFGAERCSLFVQAGGYLAPHPVEDGFWMCIEGGLHSTQTRNPLAESAAQFVCVETLIDHWDVFLRAALAMYVEENICIQAQSYCRQGTADPYQVTWQLPLRMTHFDTWVFMWIPWTLALRKLVCTSF